ncbi:helix-turn-helix transcriptional regulator [Bacillus atrophaeus]|uniref:helix-turn-helix transcriptional regulator n=1 Tax=Bacillus atrophaeus TaxID=1452 RepID=UPI0022801654|nr:helix-turn-helix transcriptional regulator [Bacillus atrophaeus]MCY8810570.1 helix-turn-helix transcriptional regulator [Bacillus atrophaeus]MCY8907721.1 helix-turn-helix transcriptional regulator [Bacillus atrophaeus]MEC0837726.1 helix-turn-helix transcriptional regulator [Bacillus atrophaeus]MEC0847627.1 helix-turn-helix transcriptional regulator [Bacillus atrophaeus]MEC0849847.1 helix-turn-helix transcriptional regulator [Bacillus atrophaeus]
MEEIKKVLESFIPLAKSTAKMFGPNCEVVIHDLTNPQASVMFTVNNHVTGREIGQSFDHLVKTVLQSEDFKEDYLAGYTFETEDKRTIRSSTSLIRDSKQKVIGAFCINFDVEALNQMQQFMNTFLSTQVEVQENETKSDDDIENVEGIVDQLIQQIIQNSVHPVMKRHEKIELIRFMDEKGIFLMKGSVEKVASLLGISKVTVYSYLDEIKNKSS